MIVIDFYVLILELLPPVHHKIEVIEYLRASMKPINDISNDFHSFFARIKYEMQFNGQVCSLEDLLNEEFDTDDRSIYITDAINLSNTFIFNNAEENESTFIFNNSEVHTPVYIFNDWEIQNFDFIVNIPSSVIFDAELLKYYVNKYKCAGKRWKIEII